MKHRFVSLVLAGLWLCMAGSVRAKMLEAPLSEKKIERMQEQELPVYLHAKTLEYQETGNVYIGRGYVDIRYGDMRLRADEAVFYADTGQTRATGNVILDDGENRLVGEELEINLRSKLGILYRGEAFLAPAYFLTGEKIERLAEDKFLITRGTYTTCDQSLPDWKFRVERCLVHLEHYAYLTDFSLYIKKVPVFRFPYALLPIKTQRATGLLIPRLGYSNIDGFIVGESFFWAINDWADATVSADYFSKRGIGSSLEMRYALTPEDEGKLQSYLIRDWLTKQDRWKTYINIRQELGDGVKSVLRADLLSDRRYEQDLDTDISRRRRQEQDSYLWLYKNWDAYGASSIAEYTEDLYNTRKNKRWRLPELKIFAISQPVLDTPLFYKLELSGLNWSRDLASGEEETQRLHLYPQVRLPLEIGPRSVITPRAGYLQTWYTKNQQGVSDQRGLYELGIRLDGPQPYRIYERQASSGLTKIKHLFQPFIDYSYISQEDQADLLKFDALDEIPGENIVRYGIMQHVLGFFSSPEQAEALRELLLLTISQEYDIGAERREELSGQPRRPFLPLKFDLELKPTPRLRLDWELRYDVYTGKVADNNMDSWLTLSDYMSLVAGWRYTNGEIDDGQTQVDNINTLYGGVNLNLGKKIALGFSGNHNVEYNQWVEKRYSLTYTSQCWSVGLSFVDRFDKDDFIFNISMTGLS